MTTNILTQARLRLVLDYDPETGVFTRKSGKIAGTTRPDGYKKITVDQVQYYAHRLAWLYMTGDLSKDIDHIDRNPSNNCFSNLRAVTKSQNQHNRVKSVNNTSGYKGVVYFKRTRRWRAVIWVDNSPCYLGYFATPEEANVAYQNAAIRFHSHRPERHNFAKADLLSAGRTVIDVPAVVVQD